MNCLPLPRSSAGVPRKTISPANSSRSAARAIAAPTPEAAIVLWPQPWPRPGSASYSASTPTRGPSGPLPAGQPAANGRREAPRRVLDRVAVRGRPPPRTKRRRGTPRTPAPGWRGSARELQDLGRGGLHGGGGAGLRARGRGGHGRNLPVATRRGQRSIESVSSGEEHEDDDEQGDGEREDAVHPQLDEEPDDEADPQAAPRRRAASRRDRRSGGAGAKTASQKSGIAVSPTAVPISHGAEDAGDGVLARVAVQDEERDDHPRGEGGARGSRGWPAGRASPSASG